MTWRFPHRAVLFWLVAQFALTPGLVHAQSVGGACTGSQIAALQTTGSNLYCSSSVWTYPAYQFGAATANSGNCASSYAGEVQWTGSAMQYCDGTNWDTIQTAASAYDLSMFWPGPPPASSIVRVVSARTATYPASLTGSSCVAKEGATSSTSITINKIHSGASTGVGTVTFAAGGSANQTCSFTSSSGISLVAGDVVEFAFPSTPDATLGDIAITLEGTHL